MSKKWMIMVISFFVCISGSLYLFTFQGNQRKVFSEEETEASMETEAFFLMGTEEDLTKEETIQVYICGEVNAPGVYTINGDKRLVDLIDLCKGFTKNAALTSVNLAGKLMDGEKIYIPSIEEEHINQEELVSTGKININIATQEQLMTLPGIGKAKASDILLFRETCGRFQSIEELMQVEGIKEGVYNKIKDLITV